MKKILWTCLLGITLLPVRAQQTSDARKVLDATANRVTAHGGVKASFKADKFSNGQLQGSAMGTMNIKGEKFQLTTPDMITWYNGETQWSYIKANEEVNISVPTVEEQISMNPYTFVNLYKKGYTYSMKESTLRGKACYEVTLTATDSKKNIHTIIISVDKKDYTPMCVRMQMNDTGQWTRIAVHQFQTGQPFSDTDFEFNPKDFPQAEVIDLR